MANIKTNNTRRKKYDVALSFAEEDRPFVRDVVGCLRDKDIRFFYDDDKRIESWGEDLYPYLADIYREQTRFCVIFISRYYPLKYWTTHELEQATAMSFFMKHQKYIWPFKLDDSEIKGVPKSMAFLSAEKYDAAQLAQAIIDKLELNKTAWSKLKRDIRKVATPKVRKLGLALAAGGLLSYSLADKFTPVDILTRKLYERNTEIIDIAKCRDSTISHSRRQGTCSSHDGVAYRFKDTIYHKSMEECRREAEATSFFSSDKD